VTGAEGHGESQDELRARAREQAALRRVTSMSSGGRDQSDIFLTAVREAREALSAETVLLERSGGEGSLEPLAQDPAGSAHPAGNHGGATVASARIVVDGRRWGLLTVAWQDGAAPAAAQERVARFADALGTAVASSINRDALHALAAEQAALRRVATLVAQGAPPSAVFASVVTETKALFGSAGSGLVRFEGDAALLVASHVLDHPRRPPLTPGMVIPLDGESAVVSVSQTGQPTAKFYSGSDPAGRGAFGRIAAEYEYGSTAAAPVFVGGRLWGALVQTWELDQAMPVGTPERLAGFTQLVGTAIANSARRAELEESRARLLEADDAERRRVQRQLQAGVQRRLSALADDLSQTCSRLRECAAGADRVEALCSALLSGLADAAAQVDAIAGGLHPAGIDAGGLEPALRKLAAGSALPVALNLERPLRRLPESLEVATYYVISEALANAIKHSGATQLWVCVSAPAGMLRVTVGDDGAGGADAARGGGLSGLVDRVTALGGELLVESPPDGGTTLSMSVPLSRRVADQFWGEPIGA
jgi:signal transduction histidine kinase